MNWFANHRQAWIAEMLQVYGHINRVHLMRKFGISWAQAALDFNEFNDTDPSAMQYDNRQKTYVAASHIARNIGAPNGECDTEVTRYLEAMDNRLLARDGSAELTHEEAKRALRNVYLISKGLPPAFPEI